MTDVTVPPTAQRAARRADALCLGLIVAATLGLHAPGLSHVGIHNWDESLHQAATRGTYDTPLRPHIYDRHLYPEDPAHVWVAEVWLHNPVLPLWLGALMMHLVGVTPLAERLVGLLALLGTAYLLLLMLRRHTGHALATLGALGLVTLRFGWTLSSGEFFGDVYDLTLTFFVTASVWALIRAFDRRTLASAALAGALMGLSYLSKSVLGLAPFGVAMVLTATRWPWRGQGLRFSQAAVLGLALAATALPWVAYTAVAFPEVFASNARVIAGHLSLFHGPPADVGGWARPRDAVLIEQPGLLGFPFPPALFTVATLWLGWSALRKRDVTRGAIALWVLSTQVVHSFTLAKPPGHLWSIAPGLFAALVFLLEDARTRPYLAAAFLTAWAAPDLGRTAPVEPYATLGRLRSWVPESFVQVRTDANYLGAVVAALLVGLVGWALWQLLRRPRRLSLVTGPLAVGAMAYSCLWVNPRELFDERARHLEVMSVSHTRELGLALDQVLPKKSVLFQEFDADPRDQFEVQNLMFWSGRITYRRPLDVGTAQAKGYHPYVVSPAAEPFEQVPGVPPCASLRAFDGEKPTNGPSPLPQGLTALEVPAGPVTVVGLAHCPRPAGQAVYAFYVRPTPRAGPLHVEFWTDAPAPLRFDLPPEASLRGSARLDGAAWYVVPVLGPAAATVKRVTVGPDAREVPL